MREIKNPAIRAAYDKWRAQRKPSELFERALYLAWNLDYAARRARQDTQALRDQIRSERITMREGAAKSFEHGFRRGSRCAIDELERASR